MRSGWRVAVIVAFAVVAAGGAGSAVATATDAPNQQAGDDPPPERWNRTYGPTAGSITGVGETANGTVFAVGSTLSTSGTELDGLVVNTTVNGTEHWNRTYGGSSNDVFTAVEPTADGGAVLAGRTISRGPSEEDGWAMKIGQQGRVRWRLATGGPGTDRFHDVERTSRGYLFVGSYTEGQNTDGWAVHVRENGTIAWTNRYDVGITDSLRVVEPYNESGYILAGETDAIGNPGTDGLVLYVGPNGSQRNQYTYGTQSSSRFLTAASTDGGTVLGGATRAFGSSDEQGWVIRIDTAGWKRWERTYDTAPLSAVASTADGGYLLASATAPSAGPSDAIAIRLRDDGTLAWNRSYGGPSYESFAAITAVADGGYVFGGTSGTDRGWSGTSWLVKLGGQEPPAPVVHPSQLPEPEPEPTNDTANETDNGTTTAVPTTEPVTTTDSAGPGPDESEEEGGLPLLWLLGGGVVVVIFLFGFLFLLWDLADDPLETLDRRTPLVDLTVIFNRLNVGKQPSPDAAGAGHADVGGESVGFDDGEPTADTAGAGADVGDDTGDLGAEAGDLDAESGDIGGESDDLGGMDDSLGGTEESPAEPLDGDDSMGGAEGGLVVDDEADSTADTEEATDDSSVPTTQAPVPGTFTLRNVGSESLFVRFRCHTTEEVVFDYWVDIKPGQTRVAHATPINDPFEILINVRDERLSTQVFVNQGRAGANVTATVSDDDIDIRLTEEVDDSKLIEAARAFQEEAEPEGEFDDTDSAEDDWTPDIDVVDPDEPDAGGDAATAASADLDESGEEFADADLDDSELEDDLDDGDEFGGAEAGLDDDGEPDSAFDESATEIGDSEMDDLDESGDELGEMDDGGMDLDDSGDEFGGMDDGLDDGSMDLDDSGDEFGGMDDGLDDGGMDDGSMDLDDSGDEFGGMDDGGMDLDDSGDEFGGMDDGLDDDGMDLDDSGDEFGGMDDGGMDDDGMDFGDDDGLDDDDMDFGDDDGLDLDDDDDDGGDSGGDSDGDKSFQELKEEFESGDADWADE